MRLIQSMTLVAVGLAAATANADTIHVPDDYPTVQGALFTVHDGDE